MTTAAAPSPLTAPTPGSSPLQVERSFRAPPERVFRAWTTADELRQWADPDPRDAEVEVDLRVGGTYRIAMARADGTVHRVTGVYQEIDPPRRLAYTWRWESMPGFPDTLVTVEFRARVDGGTDLVLVHEGLPTDDARRRHAHGWGASIAKIATLTDGAPGEPPGYARTLAIRAPRDRVFDAVATVEGLRGRWWTRTAGTGLVGDVARLDFGGAHGPQWVVLRLDAADRPGRAGWTCVAQHMAPPNFSRPDEWLGTRLTFDVEEAGPDACTLRFRHAGLTPALDCYGLCERGWDTYLASLVAYAETGRGTPAGG